MKVRTTVRRAEQQLRAAMIQEANSPIESRIAYAVEQALMWTHTHGSTATPLDIARVQAKLLTEELASGVKPSRVALP